MGIIFLHFTKQIENILFFALLAGIPLSVIGLLDDIANVKPVIRFLIQIFCALSGLYFLNGFSSIDLGFIRITNVWILLPIALIGIIWAINLFNFLDGIDGYISSEVIFICIAIFIIFHDLVSLLLAISVLGFLYWNWQKAKIFMGDVCSTLLGYNVAIFAIYYQNTNKSSLMIWLILTSVFWFDATITLFRRIKNKENLSQAHRKHAFQRIVQAGFSHQKTVIWAFLLNLLGLGLIIFSLKMPGLGILFLAIDIFILFIVLNIIDKKKPFEKNNQMV
jgi:Fuc2NAc and GlcNAc transferase